jgi:hypothetical protein
MPLKNKIKIDSFVVDGLKAKDIPEALRLAVKAQSAFGLSETAAPSLFLNEIKDSLQRNMEFSFVFRTVAGKVFGVFIIRPETNISAELVLALSDPNISQTKEMYDEFRNILNSFRFKMFFAKVYKKRKKIQIYIRFLNILGFKEILNENEEFITLCSKKT